MKKIFDLKKWILVAVFFLPAYVFRFSVGGIPTNGWEVLVMFVLFLWLWEKRSWKNVRVDLEKLDYWKKYFFPIGMILGGLFLGAFFSTDPTTGIGIIKGWFFFPLLFFFLIGINFDLEERRLVFLAILWSDFCVAIISLGYFLSHNLTYDGRLQAFFNSPNYLAMYLSSGIIVGFLYLIDGIAEGLFLKAEAKNSKLKAQSCNSKFKTIFFGISFLIILGAYYLTFSYASWVALVISFGVIFWLKNGKSKKSLLLIGLFLVAVFWGIILIQGDNKKLQDLASFSERSSLASREMIWHSAGKIIQDHWIFGIGPGNFQRVYLDYQKYFPPYLEWAVPHPHNIFLAFWFSGGILAFLGFLWLLFLYFKEMWNNDWKEKDWLQLASLSIMVYFLVHGMVDTTYFKNDLAVIFWLSFLALRRPRE